MRHVYLPIEHSDADLALAGTVAERLESRSLYVTWAGASYSRPDVETLWREPAAGPVRAPAPDRPGLLAEAVGQVVAFVAALRRPRLAA